tara:strand:+ start:1135 stop:2028 length:894 start_codon:yes stop_codon:yes gene_type:complete
MNSKQSIKKHLTKKLSIILISATSFFLPIKTQAFIPYVYQPIKSDLEKTGLEIAKTAAQLVYLGQTKEAILLAELAISLNPEDDRIWAILAEAQIRNKDIKKASQSLQKAKQINPKKAALWFLEGSLALLQNQPNKAELLITEGLKLEPKNANAYFQLGNSLLMQNKLNKALRSYKIASKQKTKFWESLNNQGLVLFELNQKENAIQLWEKVLEINRNAEPMLALAGALNSINPKNLRSIDLAKEALSQNPLYVSRSHQKDQLWGEKLQLAVESLLKKQELIKIVQESLAKIETKNG